MLSQMHAHVADWQRSDALSIKAELIQVDPFQLSLGN